MGGLGRRRERGTNDRGQRRGKEGERDTEVCTETGIGEDWGDGGKDKNMMRRVVVERDGEK